MHGAVGASLLREADDGVEDEDRDDDRGVGVLLEQEGHAGGDQQDEDEGALELTDEEHEVADRLLRLEPVLAVVLEPLGRRAPVEAPLGGVELLEDLLDVERVPRRALWGCCGVDSLRRMTSAVGSVGVGRGVLGAQDLLRSCREQGASFRAASGMLRAALERIDALRRRVLMSVSLC